jgi:hypothetical protein
MSIFEALEELVKTGHKIDGVLSLRMFRKDSPTRLEKDRNALMAFRYALSCAEVALRDARGESK